MCSTRNKAFCYACRNANKKGLLNFSKYGDEAFTTQGSPTGRSCWRSLESMKRPRLIKRQLWNCPSKKTAQVVDVMISSQLANLQANRRAGLLKQITSLHFLLRQGLVIRGHSEDEGNLSQTLKLRMEDSDTVQAWLNEEKHSQRWSSSSSI